MNAVSAATAELCCRYLHGDGLSTVNVLPLNIHTIREALLSQFYRWGMKAQKDPVTHGVLIHLGVESSTSAATMEPAVPQLNLLWHAATDTWYLNSTLLTEFPKSLRRWLNSLLPNLLVENGKHKQIPIKGSYCDEYWSQEKDQACEMLWDSWVGHLPNFKAWLNTVAVCS